MGSGNAVTLSETDARELPIQCPDIALAVPIVRGGAQVVYGNNNWATIVYGTTPGYLEVRGLAVADGSPFSQQDVDSANKVALLGKTVVTNLFGDTDPVGQSIRIKNVPFTVVGVLEPKGQSPTGQDQDDVILLPISTAKRKVIGIKSANADAVDSITMQAKSGTQIQPAQEKAKGLLRQRHHLIPSEDDDFSIRNMEEIFAAQEASSHIMSLMLAAVASTQPRVRIQSSPPASLPFSVSRLRSARKGDFPAQNAAHAPDSIVFSFEHNSAKGAVEGWCVTRREQRSVGRLRSGDRGTD